MNAQTLTRLEEEIRRLCVETGGTVAVVFEDLTNSQNSIMINEREVFHAASTMKTPIMIAVMKLAEENKLSLDDSIPVENRFRSIVDSSEYSMDIGEDSGEGLYKELGKKVTIRRLLYDMITVSGNLATNILIDKVGAGYVRSLLRDRGIEGVNVLRGVEDIKAYEAGLNNTVTAEGLFKMFAEIERGGFCGEAYTNEMKEILLSQKFTSMIPKYLPKEAKAAHKTGSITAIMHDGGIVYHGNGSKYVLIILNKNYKNAETARENSALISKLVYDYMSGVKK
ncbi:MAG: serine hydrolase [Ignavibacteriaceae bacterium]|nr:serine hydrolase [Ignavibacteriaceae bacterium]